MTTRTLDDRVPADRDGKTTRLHDELVARARVAQDQVFGDTSVDRTTLADSLKGLADRLAAQLAAMAAVGQG